MLEQRDLLEAGMIKRLRRQIAEAPKPVSAVALARRLVEQGHLTRAQARRLLAAGGGAASQPSEPAKPAPSATPPAADREEDLGLAPLDDASEKPAASSADDLDEDLGLAPLDDEPPKKPAKKPTPKPAARRASSAKTPADAKPSKPAGAKPSKPTGAKPAATPAGGSSLFDEELPALDDDLGGLDGGPLDGLLADSTLDADTAAGGSPLAPLAPKKKGFFSRLFAKKKKPAAQKTNVWDSPLLLIGGGTLLVLLILVTVLVWAVSRQSGEDAFRQADEDYAAGSYAQAIHKFDIALEKFPNHPAASLARVHRGLSRLRQVTPRGTSNWTTALETAKAVIDEIRSEDEFPQAKPDLSAMLLAIANGLAGQAQQKLDPKLVAQAEETIELLKKYVPKELRNSVRLAEVEALLATTVREIERDDRRDQAIAAMKEASGQGDAQQAYRLRNELLKQYPELMRDESLEAAVLEVSAEQQKGVEVVAEAHAAETEEPGTPILSEVALASHALTTAAAGVDRQLVATVVRGAAYGLEASTGRVLWRRFVGMPPSPSIPAPPPVTLGAAAGSDLLLCSWIDNSLVRVEPDDGKLRWRLPVGEPFSAAPVLTGDQVLLATRSGKLLMIDAESGTSASHVKLPQPLGVAPAVDRRRRLVFQLADQSDLFVLSLPDGACRRVEYLGHEAGSITAPPVLAGRLLMFVVNDRARGSLLRVIAVEDSTDGEGLLLNEAQHIRLEGHVDAPLSVSGRRVAVATDSGAVAVFELSGVDSGKPLTKIADTVLSGAEQVIHYPVLDGGQLWIAGSQLNHYDVQTSQRLLVPRQTLYEQCALLEAPRRMGDTLFCVRRQGSLPAATVAAVASETGEPAWETQLAAPPATEPAVDAAGGKIHVLSAVAGLFEHAAADDERRAVNDQPLAAPQPGQLQVPIRQVAQLEDGRWAATFDDTFPWVAVFDPGGKTTCTWRRLPGELACPPIGLGDGLLCPLPIGQVLWWDPIQKQLRANPFQPVVEAGQRYNWCRPVDVGDGQFVISDGRQWLYRVGAGDAQPPGLTELAKVETAQPITSPLATVGSLVFGVDENGVLTAFRLPSLERLDAEEQPLDGRCVWGPARVGETVMLATDADALWCFGDEGKPAWAQPAALAHGPLAGLPLATDDGLLLASARGIVWRIDPASGEEKGRLDVGRPLGAGPVLIGEQLLLVGHDGTLYRVEQP